jgi:hypothetical protein
MTPRLKLIQELLNNNVNMILTGSVAANYYGYKIMSKSNDMDFIIEDSINNLLNIFNTLYRYDRALEANSILSSHGIRTKILDSNEYIDMFKYSKKSIDINYTNLTDTNNYIIDYFFDLKLKIISKTKLIETINMNKNNIL